MKCIVVDDEQIALEGMADYVNRTPFLELVGECSNSFEAIQLISGQAIDLVFLDINMPKLSGVDMVNSLQQAPMIIFVTAYPNYALKGFELNAVDYVLKPVSYAKFLKASQKAYNLFQLHQQNKSANQQDYIYIKVEKKLVKVKVEDIEFVEGLKDYIVIHTNTDKYVSYLSLNKIIKALPENEFIQVHKSFIVATQSINTIEGNMIKIGKQTIPIGRSYKNKLFEKVVDEKYLKK